MHRQIQQDVVAKHPLMEDCVASDGGHEGRQCFGIVGGRAEVV